MGIHIEITSYKIPSLVAFFTVGDGYCDKEFDKAEYDFDNGDCREDTNTETSTLSKVS